MIIGPPKRMSTFLRKRKASPFLISPFLPHFAFAFATRIELSYSNYSCLLATELLWSSSCSSWFQVWMLPTYEAVVLSSFRPTRSPAQVRVDFARAKLAAITQNWLRRRDARCRAWSLTCTGGSNSILTRALSRGSRSWGRCLGNMHSPGMHSLCMHSPGVTALACTFLAFAIPAYIRPSVVQHHPGLHCPEGQAPERASSRNQIGSIGVDSFISSLYSRSYLGAIKVKIVREVFEGGEKYAIPS